MTKLSERTIWREIKAGRLVTKRLGNQQRIEETDLLNWINRYTKVASENAVVAPGQHDPNKLSSPQPDKNIPQTEIEPNNANTSKEKSGERAGAGEEKAAATKTTKNAEILVKYWNLYSPIKEPVTLEGHLHEPMKHKVEQFMVENNNDLKSCFTAIRNVLLLYNKNLIKGKITLKRFIGGDYQTRFAFPKLSSQQEQQLEGVVRYPKIFCYHCKKLYEIFEPTKKDECPICGERDAIDIQYELIITGGMKKYPVLKLFYDKYKVYLEQVQKKVSALQRKYEKDWFPARYKFNQKHKVNGLIPDKNKLGWSIIADMYNIKKEIYGPQYVQKMIKQLPADLKHKKKIAYRSRKNPK